MLIKMRHWHINLRQQSRLSLKFPQWNSHRDHLCKKHNDSNTASCTKKTIKDIRDWLRSFRLPSSWPEELAGSFPVPTSWHTKTKKCPVPQCEKLPPIFYRPTRQKNAAFPQHSWCIRCKLTPCLTLQWLVPAPLLSVNCKRRKAVCWPCEKHTNIFMSLQTVSNRLRGKDS